MFLSTDTGRLPNVGDLVTRYDFRLPWLVTRRQRDPETKRVLLSLQHGDVTKAKVAIECLEYWPQQGDKVAVALKPFLHWANAYQRATLLKDSETPISPVSGVFKVLGETGPLATVRLVGGRGKWAGYQTSIWIDALRVLEKADGRMGR